MISWHDMVIGLTCARARAPDYDGPASSDGVRKYLQARARFSLSGRHRPHASHAVHIVAHSQPEVR